MKPLSVFKRKQTGSVAILAGLALLVLFGFLGLVVDLGNLYVNKTELQNAADAAALSGARELDGSSGGIAKAVQAAKAISLLNSSQLGKKAVLLEDIHISFSNIPSGGWADIATASADPEKMSFIKIDTRGIEQGSLNTWFIRVLSPTTTTTQTHGLAVGGRGHCEALPMFTCTINSTPPFYGYVPGQEYRFTDTSGSTIGPGNVGYMDPVPPGAPSLVNGGNAMRDLICQGKTYCMTAGNNYSSLSQAAFGMMADALNTRFGDYKGSLKNFVQQCRPDTNVMEYPFNALTSNGPKTWMATAPSKQSESEGGLPGVHWSSVRPGSGATPAVSAGYPASGTPYSQTGLPYSKPTPVVSDRAFAQAGRRILPLGLADNCGAINGAGKPVHIVGFARFFMPVKADGTGSPKKFYGEFIDVVGATPADASSIKLYQ